MAVLHDLFERLDGELPLRGLAWEGSLRKSPRGGCAGRPYYRSRAQGDPGPQGHAPAPASGGGRFPGGKREPEDVTPWVTALREAHEEIGLGSELAEPLGELSPLITRTGFEVHPCVARVPAELELVVDPREFDSVFMAPLEIFADRDLFRLEAMSDGVRTRMVPHYQVGDDNIWGVTAAVLAQLANLAFDAGLDLQRNWTVTP